MWSLPALVPCRWNWQAEFPVWYPLGYYLSISKKKCSQPRGINLNLFICLNSKTPALARSLARSVCVKCHFQDLRAAVVDAVSLCLHMWPSFYRFFFSSLHNNKEIHCMSWHYNLLNLLWIFRFVRSPVFLSDQGSLTGLHEKCCIFFPSLLWRYCLVSFNTTAPFQKKKKTCCKHWIK